MYSQTMVHERDVPILSFYTLFVPYPFYECNDYDEFLHRQSNTLFPSGSREVMS